jgi:hypothetical protein
MVHRREQSRLLEVSLAHPARPVSLESELLDHHVAREGRIEGSEDASLRPARKLVRDLERVGLAIRRGDGRGLGGV